LPIQIQLLENKSPNNDSPYLLTWAVSLDHEDVVFWKNDVLHLQLEYEKSRRKIGLFLSKV
jgi:hypothetical protein